MVLLRPNERPIPEPPRPPQEATAYRRELEDDVDDPVRKATALVVRSAVA